ncbi:MAG: hypothetical protein OHK0011_23230 [Turneriella sp.]
MNVIDSSAWIEYIAGTRYAGLFEAPIADQKNLIVPVITIYEIFRKILGERDEDAALTAVSYLRSATVVDVDVAVALEAARHSKVHKLPTADALIYATAQLHNATLWTMNQHFKGLPGVKYFAKK